MVIFKTEKGYFVANDVNGAFDVPLPNYKEDAEDLIIDFD